VTLPMLLPSRRGRRRRTKGAQRGLTLAEILVAFFLLFVVTLSVLEMLSLAYAVNRGAEMRTELTYKAQQVVEQIQMQRAMGVAHACCPIASGTDFTLPGPTAGCDVYWGRGGANIVSSDDRFEIRYRVDPGGEGRLTLTVEAAPRQTSGRRYLADVGGVAAGRVVRYVARI